MILAYLRAAYLDALSFYAPVMTIFPEEKISAVVLGSLIRIITAAKRFGLYSAFLAFIEIFLRSSLHKRLIVETTFLG